MIDFRNMFNTDARPPEQGKDSIILTSATCHIAEGVSMHHVVYISRITDQTAYLSLTNTVPISISLSLYIYIFHSYCVWLLESDTMLLEYLGPGWVREHAKPGRRSDRAVKVKWTSFVSSSTSSTATATAILGNKKMHTVLIALGPCM